MPHKANAARRHHIARPKRRVTNWSAYNEALRQRTGVLLCAPDEESWRLLRDTLVGDLAEAA